REARRKRQAVSQKKGFGRRRNKSRGLNPATMIQRLAQMAKNAAPQTKTKIALVAVALAAVGLGSVWLKSVEGQLSGMDKRQNQESILGASESNFLTVESFSRNNGKAEIYFKFENQTDQILA